jgi:hypothetical protein
MYIVVQLLPSILLIVLNFARDVFGSTISALLCLIIPPFGAPTFYIYRVYKETINNYKNKGLLFVMPLLMNSVNIFLLYVWDLQSSDIGFLFNQIAIVSTIITVVGCVIAYFVAKKK